MARAAAVALALTLAACTHQPMLFGEPVPKGCAAEVAVGTESCMGWYIDRLKLIEHAEYDDRELARYVSSVGERVARAAGDRRAWTFRVIDDYDPQGEANVSTTVYITRGALARLRDEAELAGMLGHEIGHVLGGHARDAVIERSRGVRESTGDLQSQRDDEIQADELAVLLTQRAGYDPHAVETMLRALAAGDPSDDPDRGSDPHPRWTERLARIQAFAMRFHGGEHRAKEYLAHIDGLVIDNDPRNAHVTGSTAVFARAGLAIDLADHWSDALTNSEGVTVSYPDDIEVRFFVIPTRGVATIKPYVQFDHYFETIAGPNGRTLVIDAHATDGAPVAKHMRAEVRLARPDEIARQKPRRIDLKTPRVLWPDEVPDDPGAEARMTWPGKKS